MRAAISEMSEFEFQKLDLPVLFEDKLTDRIFGVISNGLNEYKISWQSTIIKPKVICINDSLCCVGIDLIFIIFDFTSGRIMRELLLDNFFYDAKIYNNFLYVITQLEITKINIAGLEVVKTYVLPDYFENIEFKDDGIVVKCLNGEVIKME